MKNVSRPLNSLSTTSNLSDLERALRPNLFSKTLKRVLFYEIDYVPENSIFYFILAYISFNLDFFFESIVGMDEFYGVLDIKNNSKYWFKK